MLNILLKILHIILDTAKRFTLTCGHYKNYNVAIHHHYLSIKSQFINKVNARFTLRHTVNVHIYANMVKMKNKPLANIIK